MGEKRSSARFRDLKLSFFSDCGSTGSISKMGPGISKFRVSENNFADGRKKKRRLLRFFEDEEEAQTATAKRRIRKTMNCHLVIA